MGVEVQFYSFFNLGARWGGWSTPCPRPIYPPRMTRYPLYRSLSGLWDRYGRVRKISPRSEIRPPYVQPVASRYADWAIPAQGLIIRNPNFKAFGTRCTWIRARILAASEIFPSSRSCPPSSAYINPYPTAFPYGNGMVLHFYQLQESSTTKTVHKVINKGLKTYV